MRSTRQSAVDCPVWAALRNRARTQAREEGLTVSCPGLPGCSSQDDTEAEALENMQDANREYLAAVDDLVKGEDVREVNVTV